MKKNWVVRYSARQQGNIFHQADAEYCWTRSGAYRAKKRWEEIHDEVPWQITYSVERVLR